MLGLEFDDVLIYNFFSNSPASLSAWRYTMGVPARTKQANVQQKPPPPPVLCSELKLLYVAVTRARRRCWIWDSGEVVDALKVSYKKKSYAQLISMKFSRSGVLDRSRTSRIRVCVTPGGPTCR
jgi:ATP-dependent exoDNAse (exonuclease V) beta subunit